MAKEENNPSKRGLDRKSIQEKWGLDWKSIQEPLASDSGEAVSGPKRRQRKLRQISEHYFIPRRSLPYNLCFYGAFIAGGIGAGMLIEIWMNKKVAEDGGVIYEFDK